jgi:NAD(P)-dependent dehydrogenase (short-subunit alcohol dehydrogenase family)
MVENMLEMDETPAVPLPSVTDPDAVAAALAPVVLVTGAARRIGRAIALDLAAHGWAVAVHHNASGEAAAEVVEAIVDAGGRAVALPCDFASDIETESLIDAATLTLGPVTGLVNNASVFEYDALDTVTRGTWEAHQQVNLWAPLLLIQQFARALPEDTGGSVVNLIDQRVWNLTPHFISYTVSKAGLWTLTRTLAMALAPRIRVNAVGPGPVLPSSRQSEDHFRRQWAGVPLARPVPPEEICAAVRFLLEAPSITGQMIAVDSGQHLGSAHRTREERPAE